MKNVRLNYLVVGSFMVAIVAALVVTVALLTGRTGATDEYYAHYGNVTGLEFGTRVLFEGYPIGQVERIVPEEADGTTRFRVEMSVVEGWKIARDSLAEIAASGLLAAVTINVRAGSSREYLKPGEQIRSREWSSVMSAVGDLARDVQEITNNDIKPMISRLSAIVGGIGDMMGTEGGEDVRSIVQSVTKSAPDIVRNLTDFADRLNQSSGQFERLLSDQNVKTINGIIDNMGLSADNMNRLTRQLDETRKAIDGVVGNVDAMVGDVNVMLRDNKLDLERAIVEMRHSVEAVSRHIDAINENLEGASRNMVEFTRAIRSNPGLLMGGTPPVDTAPTR